MSCTRQTGDCKVLSRCVTSPCIMDRPSAYAPGAVFDEEAGHGGAEACRRAEALALSMSPRLNSQNPGLFCQLLFDDSCQALKLTQAIFALKSRRAPARHLLQAICAQCIYLNLNKPPRAQTRRSTSKANFRWR
jgi:hypothetical protein